MAIKNINGNKTCATTKWEDFKKGFNDNFEFDSNKQAYKVKKAEALSSPNCKNDDYVQFFDGSKGSKGCQLSNAQIAEAINFSKK